MMNPDSKFKLRKIYRERRAQIPLSYRQEAASSATKLCTENLFFKESDHIACYLPAKDEFDASPLIEAIWQAKKLCYLPVLVKEDEKSLFFVRYQYGDPLHPNRYSILEPVNTTQRISAELLDMTITPLVAFDLFGHRLGTGGGYYDRTFAFLQHTKSQKPKMIGLAYAVQEAKLLPFDPWDVLLDGVVTERSFISFD